MRLLCYLTIPLLVFLPEVRTSEPSNAPLDVRMYFSEVDNDMTKVTWVHRCNSKVKLESALASKVMMIESDIIAGHLEGDGGGPPIPVMGHPPDTTGDLSLEQFLDMVLQHGSGKGIKLDFKSLAIFKASENVLEQFLAKAEVDFPVWINADILQGPGEPKREAVEPNYFLRTCVNKFPLASISAGWTVDVSSAKNLQYNSTHIDEMTSLLIENNVVHPVTFPVHAGIAANSLDALRSLVHSSVDGTSLTIWCGSGEWVDYNKLRQLISVIGRDKLGNKFVHPFYGFPRKGENGGIFRPSRDQIDFEYWKTPILDYSNSHKCLNKGNVVWNQVFVDMPEDMMSKLLSPHPSPTPPSKAIVISAALSSLTLLLTVLICVN